MEQITGQRKMSAKSLMNYFQPLTDWLKKQNNGTDDIGWSEDCPDPVAIETDLNKTCTWLEYYDKEAQREYNVATLADWNYANNITDENQKKQVRLSYKIHAFLRKRKTILS